MGQGRHSRSSRQARGWMCDVHEVGGETLPKKAVTGQAMGGPVSSLGVQS